VLVLVALAVATTCTLLGRWQWHKHVTRDALIATVNANWAAPAVPLTSLVAAPDDQPAASDEWRSVSLTGHYLAASAVLLRNRPVNGQPAYHVLVPFQADGGGVLVVDRGWVPVGNDAQRGTDVPAPPSGTVDLVARLRVPEPPSTRSAPAGQVQNFSPAQVLAAGNVATGAASYRWYAGLVSESPAPTTPLQALATPSTDPGPYLSYALQWWVFALGALAAFGWMARREITDDLALHTTPPHPVPAGTPSPRTRGLPEPEGVSSTPGRAAGTASTATAASLAPEPAGSAVGTASAALPSPVAQPGLDRAATPQTPPPARRRRGRDELAEDALIDAQHPRRPA
jgi:cytochrome oxidase assembly protein ShyY1